MFKNKIYPFFLNTVYFYCSVQTKELFVVIRVPDRVFPVLKKW